MQLQGWWFYRSIRQCYEFPLVIGRHSLTTGIASGLQKPVPVIAEVLFRMRSQPKILRNLKKPALKSQKSAMIHASNVFCRWMTAKKLHARKNRRAAAASVAEKGCRENPVSLSWLARRDIAAVKTHVLTYAASGNIEDRHRLVFCESWPWPSTFDPKIHRFPGFIMEHLYVKFTSVFETSCGNTDKHINAAESPNPWLSALVKRAKLQCVYPRV